ncbi:EAL and HDOD domain-containing protein [Thaumasiovibrio subtropicus]|uniref:EAL and HDOD domain-containing protein n=1 Tax=Thaumasiovibrio subtropicus TaxID=1891207 RepID=UPI000B35695D|nr:EAL domain-containing protein [Thaumasiovibrio subtropicus]
MNSFVARQPILNSKLETVAYELLFRDGPNNAFPQVSAEYATSRLLIERITSLQNNTSNKKNSELAFINFPEKSLVDLTPTLFPKTDLVIEILEDCEPNDALFNAVKKLHARGYTLALDDFENTPEWRRFFPYISIIKFDLLSTSLDEARKFIHLHSHFNIKYLAEKVETHEQFQAALNIGFEYFQGYFFAKPEIIEQRSLSPSAMTTMRLFKAISETNVDFAEVESIVSSDVSISYKLLRYVNTMTAVDSKPIVSFKQALVFLGENRLRRFVYLVATAYATDGKGNTLYLLSIQRARFCELVAPYLSMEPSEAFLTGLFSLLDSLLDQPIETLLSQLPLSSAVKSALIESKGRLGGIVALAKAYDRADWHRIKLICQHYRLDETRIADCYVDSLEWTQDFVNKSQQ